MCSKRSDDGPHDEISTVRERVLTAAATSGWFLLVYNFTNWVSSLRADHGVAAFSWEQHIPFVPLFIIPYWSIDLFFVAAPFVIRRRADLVLFAQRIFAAVGIAGVFFLLFPLELQFERPPVTGLLGTLFSSLETMNNFWNLAPSLHIALRTILWTVYIPRVQGISSLALRGWFLCIGLSTLLCWQHHVIDVFTGQLLGLSVIHFVRQRDRSRAAAAPAARHRALALRYGAGSFLCVAATWIMWPYSFPLLWPALALATVALAYRTNRPELLGKRDGRVAAASFWLLLPYTAVATRWQRQYLEGQPRRWQLTPKVSFGSMLPESKAIEVEARSVVDLTAEYRETGAFLEREYYGLPWLDLVAPSGDDLLEAARLIDRCERRGTVYVHCALGRGRSALAVAAWLLYSGACYSAEEAVNGVRSVCGQALFDADGMARLQDLDQEIRESKRA